MKIWHQSFTVLDDVPAYRDALRQRVEKLLPPGDSVELHGMIPGTFTGDYPGSDLSFNFLYWLHGLQWVAAAREAEARGFDAMVLASMSDPMLREIRTIVDIPVAGYGEAAFNVASQYGRRVAMLVFIVERRDIWPERVRQWGASERFAGVGPAGVAFQDVMAAYDDPARLAALVARLEESADRLIRETGADVIVPAEMPLNLILARAGVNRLGKAAVVDGLAACLDAAGQMVRFKAQGIMAPSEQGYFNVRPDKRRVAQALAFYGLEDLGKRIPGA